MVSIPSKSGPESGSLDAPKHTKEKETEKEQKKKKKKEKENEEEKEEEKVKEEEGQKKLVVPGGRDSNRQPADMGSRGRATN